MGLCPAEESFVRFALAIFTIATFNEKPGGLSSPQRDW